MPVLAVIYFVESAGFQTHIYAVAAALEDLSKRARTATRTQTISSSKATIGLLAVPLIEDDPALVQGGLAGSVKNNYLIRT